jgi:hypothetical protein
VPITIIRPDNEETALRPIETKHFAQVIYEKTDLSGIYELKIGAPVNQTEWYAVNVDPRESSLDYVGEEELTNDLLPGVEMQHVTQWQDGPRKSDGSLSERGGLTRWLLLAVFCLVLVELLMAWKFQYGFALLCLIVAGVMLGQFFAQFPGLTAAVLLGGLIVVAALALRRRSRRTQFS